MRTAWRGWVARAGEGALRSALVFVCVVGVFRSVLLALRLILTIAFTLSWV